MGIYLGDKQGTLYKGDYKPVNLYHGDKKAAGWGLSEKTGTELSWDDTYNDKVLSAVVEGKSEQAVTVQGKNLLDISKWSAINATKNGIKISALPDGRIRVEGKIVDPAISSGYFSDVLPMQKSTKLSAGRYSIHRINIDGYDLEFFVGAYDADSNFITNIASANVNMTQDFYVRSVGVYVNPRIVSDIDIVLSSQLELGTTATEYEPFIPNSPSPDYPSPIVSTGEVSGIDLTVTGNAGQSYQVHRDMVLRSLPDGTHDTWDALTGTVTRNVGVKVFDGTESLVERTDMESIYPKQRFFIYSMLFKPNTTGLSSHFQVYGGANWYSVDDGIWFQNNGSYILFNTKTSVVPDIANFKSFLAAQYAAGTPIIVQYKLATPIIEQIDPAPLPTYPRYTALECTVPVTASARIVDKTI